jgi:hypothetical protein
MTDRTCTACGAEIPPEPNEAAADKPRAGFWPEIWARTRAELKLQDLLHLVSIVGLGAAGVVAGTLNWYSLSPHAVLRTSVLACRKDGVDVALSNIGNRTAFIKGGAAQVFVGKDHVADLDRQMIPETNLILKSRESATLTFKLKEKLSPMASDEQRSQCHLNIAFNWIEAGSDLQPVSGECACPPKS